MKKNSTKEPFIDYRKILAIIQKNFIVMTRDKTRLIPLLTFPIVMIIVFGYISGNIPKHISTAIVPYDHSPISERIQQEIQNNEVFSVKYVVSTEGEAKKLLDAAKISAIIEIPPHLKKDIGNNIPASITVIVDESDASIGAAVKQTMASIVSQLSHKISMERFSAYQASVAGAAARISIYSSSPVNMYSSIASSLKPGQDYLIQSKKTTDDYVQSLMNSLPLPVIYVPSISNGRYNKVDDKNTYVNEPVGTATLKAQIAILQASSKYVGYTSTILRNVIQAAEDAQRITQASQDTHEENIGLPIKKINVFTHAKAADVLTPLVYEEKPAYGTGKRAIDFVIPAIIALTIFQGAVMGMGRAVAGEKREGSLTRVFLTPTSNATIILGTLAFYVVFEIFRSAFIILVAMALFNIKIEGSLLLIALTLMIYAGVCTAIGMIFSSMVKTEQQYMGMAMLVSMPTIFLSGAFFPIQAMPKFMQVLALWLPVTYAGDAIRGIMIKGFGVTFVWYPLLILLLFLVVMVGLVFMVFKRDIE